MLEAEIFTHLQVLLKKEAWNDLSELNFFGMHLPLRKEPYYISILGSRGLDYGFLIMNGAIGMAYFIEQAFPDTGLEEDFYGQDMIYISYRDRVELTRDQYARVKDSGVTFRGKKAWPVVMDFSPGYEVVDLVHEEKIKELDFILDYLIQALEIIQEQPDSIQGLGPIPVFDFRKKDLLIKEDPFYEDYAYGLSPDLLGMKPAIFSRFEMARILSQPRIDDQWDLGFYRFPLAVEDDLSGQSRATFPYLFVLTDQGTGEVIDLDVFSYGDYQSVQNTLVEAFRLLGLLPRKIRLHQQSYALSIAYLFDLLGQLNVEVEVVENLPHNEYLAQDIIQWDYEEGYY